MAKHLNILMIDPFHTGSHAHWSLGMRDHWHVQKTASVTLWTLPGRHWKWRMHGSAATFATRIAELDQQPDVILTTDMMDVSAFRGLLPKGWRNLPIVQYFHENQLTYPSSPSDPDTPSRQDRTYAFMNIQSALAADAIWFNSHAHQKQFLEAIPAFLQPLPDAKMPHAKKAIEQKSDVLPIGIAQPNHPEGFLKSQPADPPVILWNHRWEYDKAPDRFLLNLQELQREGFPFKLILCGKQFKECPEALADIRTRFSKQILHDGYVESRSEYLELLRRADIAIHEPRQEYFGISLMESMQAGVLPLVSRGNAYDDYLPKWCFRLPELSLSQQLTTRMESRVTLGLEMISVAEKYNWNEIVHRADGLLASLLSNQSFSIPPKSKIN
jgi:glycosyltransferase involved in cell wall biosynthesis